MSAYKKDIKAQREMSNAVAEKLSLIDIRLTKVASELHVPAPRLPLAPIWSLGATVDQHPNLAVYFIEYQFSAKDEAGKSIFNISLMLMLVFNLNGHSVDEEHLQMFGAYGVVEIAHPYLREMVHNLTARMGVPPFVVEVLAPNSAHIEPAVIAVVQV